jgi:hypothetical protein
VYRVLELHGLVRTITLAGFPASQEFWAKTTVPDQLWQSDAGYHFRGGLGLLGEVGTGQCG